MIVSSQQHAKKEMEALDQSKGGKGVSVSIVERIQVGIALLVCQKTQCMLDTGAVLVMTKHAVNST